MGKGDKKSKRGKIVIGSYGVRRPRKKRKGTPAPAGVTENKDIKNKVGKPEEVTKEPVKEQPEEPVVVVTPKEEKAVPKAEREEKTLPKDTVKKPAKPKAPPKKEPASEKPAEKTIEQPEAKEEAE